MQPELAVPGVQYSDEPQLTAKQPRLRGDGLQRPGRLGEEQVVQQRRVDERQPFDWFWQRERHQKIRHRQKPRRLPDGPRDGLPAAATRTRTVMTTVVAKVGFPARAAAVNLPAERRRAAALDLGERTRLRPGHGAATPIARGKPNQ
jgi:hypothetical protein